MAIYNDAGIHLAGFYVNVIIGWMSNVAMSKTGVKAATIGWLSKLSFRHRDVRHPADWYFRY